MCVLPFLLFYLYFVSRYPLQDYVATRWYRAPELCGSFFSKVWLSFACASFFVFQPMAMWVGYVYGSMVENSDTISFGPFLEGSVRYEAD